MSTEQQIQSLVDFIQRYFPEYAKSGGAGDIVIEIIKRLIRENHRIRREVWKTRKELQESAPPFDSACERLSGLYGSLAHTVIVDEPMTATEVEESWKRIPTQKVYTGVEELTQERICELIFKDGVPTRIEDLVLERIVDLTLMSLEKHGYHPKKKEE